jgi:hypothetical protein
MARKQSETVALAESNPKKWLREHKRNMRPEIREYYRREPERRSWLWWERDVLNSARKLEPYERLAVQIFVELLAHSRIKARLQYKTRKGRFAVDYANLSEIYEAI